MISKYKLNDEAFSEPLSSESRYWLGFLLADGCISLNKGIPVISLGLHLGDIGHVKKFARFAGVGEESVKEVHYDCHLGRCNGAIVSFSGKMLISRLAKYGVVPRKTKIAAVHESLSNDPDFWRGLIDGDGCPRIKPYPRLRLCGTSQVVNSFANYLKVLLDFRPTISAYTNSPIFQTSVYGPKAIKAISVIYYTGCYPVLDRKGKLISTEETTTRMPCH